MSTYGPKADNLGASATGPNMAVFEQDKSASESAQAEWDSRDADKVFPKSEAYRDDCL